MGGAFEAALVTDPAVVDDQVWSLNQFYSVDFSQARIGVKKRDFNESTIKVCVSCFCWCPPPRLSNEAHPMAFLFL